jgi:DNA-binding NarL/FixJ family response regulator
MSTPTTTDAAQQQQPRALYADPRTVLVVPIGDNDEPVCSEVRQRVPASCVRLDGDSAISLLRSDPFSVTAVVLSGDGASPMTTSTLEALKKVAPRVPIVFLDERETADSEKTMRRAGIHYYSHLPANLDEIAAVLAHLAEAPREVPSWSGRRN